MTTLTCHHCGAPGTHGYPDLPVTQYCDACSFTHALGANITEIRQDLRDETIPERIRRALAWERAHRRRSVVIQLLEHRLARLEGAPT